MQIHEDTGPNSEHISFIDENHPGKIEDSFEETEREIFQTEKPRKPDNEKEPKINTDGMV